MTADAPELLISENNNNKGHAKNGELINQQISAGRAEEEGSSSEGGGWWTRYELPWWGRLLVPIIKLGPIPRHVAFVMDGNRRFARSHHFPSVLDGHSAGFEKLTRVLDWCDRLGIVEVTVYAFSIENFKRSEEEVQGLMRMAEQKFAQLLERRDELVERCIVIRFLGNRALLPPNIRSLMTQIESVGAVDGKAKTFLNICLAYTSQDEITRAFEHIRYDVQQGKLDESQIDADLISAYMDTRKCLPLDLFIRTSERRLSDFLLWQLQQSPHCHVHFEPDLLWPQFSLHHLLRAILHFQLAQLHNGQWRLGEGGHFGAVTSSSDSAVIKPKIC